MRAVLLIARDRLRRHFRAALALGLLLAVAGGLVAAVAAGGARASSAFDRLQASERVPDGYVFSDSAGVLEKKIERLPEVSQVAYAVALAPTAADFTPVALPDPRYGRAINRFKFLSGRRPVRPGEAMVDFMLARSRHLHVGSTLVLQPPAGGAKAEPAPVPLRIVGVVADARSFPPVPYASTNALYIDGAFLATPEGMAWQRLDGAADMVAVRLKGGEAHFSAFMQDVEKANGSPVGSDVQSSIAAGPRRSMHLQALALWLTAGFGGLVLLVIMAQLLVRQLAEHSVSAPTLRSLGMTNGQLIAADVVWTAAMAVGAVLAGSAVAYAASPLFPLGTARVADPSRGARFDAPVLLPVLALVAAAVIAMGALTALRLATRHRREYMPVSGSVFLPPLQRLPVVLSTGVRMALRPGRGRSAVPVRSTIGAAAVGVAGVIVAMTFSSSLGHLLSTPPLYGTTYDADLEVNGNFGDVTSPAVEPVVESDSDVEALAVADTGIPMTSGPARFGAEALKEIKGSILPTVVSGRLPEAPDEILLGVQTMSALHTRIGRTVPVAISGITGPLPMRVVGSGVLATASDSESLGKGAVVATSAMLRFLSHAPPDFSEPPPGDLFIRFRPGVDPTRAIPALTAKLGGIEKVIITVPAQPSDVANFGQVENLPQVLAGLLAALAAATVAYLMVSAVRRRRRELAVLKTLGFVPAQISAAVAWQATTIAVVAMVVGVPVGIIGGRAVWSAVAQQMGVVVSTQVPWLLLALLIPIVIVLANVVAAGPAAAAARLSASTALRDE